jgi:large subunit ribosomal protein L4
VQIEVKNNQGKISKSLDLDPSIWKQDFNADLLHQSIYVYLANQRQWTKGTKTRANVNYAGQKLRPQKGSGRARVGSKRSPIMVGGGVAHGPHPKDIRKSLNKKMKTKALKIALSAKLNDSEVSIIEKLPVEDLPSTKNVIFELDAIVKVQELWGDPDFKPAAAKKPAAKKTTTKKTTTKKNYR